MIALLCTYRAANLSQPWQNATHSVILFGVHRPNIQPEPKDKCSVKPHQCTCPPKKGDNNAEMMGTIVVCLIVIHA